MPDPEKQAPFFPQSSSSIFWVEVDKIKPNPFQPRHEFREEALKDLADSIRQYGVLQPMVVTRKEVHLEDGGIATEYELIAGERRLRASKLAGLREVPVLIRVGEDSDKTKLEIAIIENVQREDLNPIERGKAFQRLHADFGYTHAEIGKKMGKSREYVSNSVRLLNLPEPVIDALYAGRIGEGHARTLLMLSDRPDEQMTLYKDIMFKGLSVREAEAASRRIAYEKIRKDHLRADPTILEMEERFTEKLGTRVQIERKKFGGKVMIDFFSTEDLKNLLDIVTSGKFPGIQIHDPSRAEAPRVQLTPEEQAEIDALTKQEPAPAQAPSEEETLYSLKNFSL